MYIILPVTPPKNPVISNGPPVEVNSKNDLSDSNAKSFTLLNKAIVVPSSN